MRCDLWFGTSDIIHRAIATRCGSLMNLARSVSRQYAIGSWSRVNDRRNSPAKQRDDAGFTLIEVIVVLGILAAFVGLVLSRAPLHGGR